MEYTTKLGDAPTEAHVNYKCPCGCDAGLVYDREAGSTEMGECCCGRLMWVGADAQDVVKAHFEEGIEYQVDSKDVTLPWGETKLVALAVPLQTLEEEAQQHENDHEVHGHDYAH